jgi:hypothetical protein
MSTQTIGVLDKVGAGGQGGGQAIGKNLAKVVPGAGRMRSGKRKGLGKRLESTVTGAEMMIRSTKPANSVLGKWWVAVPPLVRVAVPPYGKKVFGERLQVAVAGAARMINGILRSTAGRMRSGRGKGLGKRLEREVAGAAGMVSGRQPASGILGRRWGEAVAGSSQVRARGGKKVFGERLQVAVPGAARMIRRRSTNGILRSRIGEATTGASRAGRGRKVLGKGQVRAASGVVRASHGRCSRVTATMKPRKDLGGKHVGVRKLGAAGRRSPFTTGQMMKVGNTAAKAAGIEKMKEKGKKS